MSDATRDLGLLRSIAADLEAYLKSDVVYWSLTDSGSIRQHYPQLTLGGLLFAQARLQAMAGRLSPPQHTELAEVSQRIAGIRARWRANWLRKAEREAATRLNAWARAVREPSQGDYPAAVQSRLMLALLLDDAGDESAPGLAGARARLSTLDSLLRGRFEPGRFALDDDLQPAFPAEAFWYLYGRPMAAS